MDLITAIALAPSQPPDTVVYFVVEKSVVAGIWYVRIDCFQKFGFDWGVEGELAFVGFEHFHADKHAHEDCQCAGPRIHRLSTPHPRFVDT